MRTTVSRYLKLLSSGPYLDMQNLAGVLRTIWVVRESARMFAFIMATNQVGPFTAVIQDLARIARQGCARRDSSTAPLM